jgi:hypothetical protein
MKMKNAECFTPYPLHEVTIKKGLRKINTLLSRKDKWAQGAEARTATGEVCIYNSEEAYSFCLLGAIRITSECSMDKGQLRAVIAEWIISKYCVEERPSIAASIIANWQDDPGRKFSEIKAMLKELINGKPRNP